LYLSLLLCLLLVNNVYLIWLIIELIFLLFLIIVINFEVKRVGLIIYFFFQSVISLILFMVLVFRLYKFVFLLLCAKLGVFPFFYWIIVVRVKVGLWGNLFVLRFQKVRVFWLLWLLRDVSLSFIYFLVYLSIFFVIFVLMSIRDLWLLLVYSSIANTGILLLRLLGDKYIFVVLLYLSVIVIIINCLIKSDSVMEIVIMVFFFYSNSSICIIFYEVLYYFKFRF